MTSTDELRPIEIGRANQHDVKIRWSDGLEVAYPARFLRFHCPCAMCQDEMTGERRLQEDSLPADVHPVSIQPVGRYAIQIYFSDGHSTGIFTWERLREMTDEIPGPGK
jgi:ATP-binding protein involved in chromosome partitioning